jgi:hypothetical protein
MLSCTHDLCLNCASDRLGYEMLKKPTSDVKDIKNRYRLYLVNNAMKKHH